MYIPQERLSLALHCRACDRSLSQEGDRELCSECMEVVGQLLRDILVDDYVPMVVDHDDFTN